MSDEKQFEVICGSGLEAVRAKLTVTEVLEFVKESVSELSETAYLIIRRDTGEDMVLIPAHPGKKVQS